MSKLFLLPIENLKFNEKFGSSIQINRVKFVCAKKFISRPGCYGFPKVLLNKIIRKPEIIWKNVSAVAIVKYKKIKNTNEFIKLVNFELEILVGSCVGWNSRRHTTTPRIQGINVHRQIDSYLKDGNQILPNSNRRLMYGSLVLGPFWNKSVYKKYFKKFTQNQKKYENNWLTTLNRVFQFCGKSQMTIYKCDAFFYNMIAIETLLFNDISNFKQKLSEVLDSFLGWCTYLDKYLDLHRYSKKASFPDIIKEIYDKRCKMVHDGITDSIEIKDIIITDIIIRNLLYNIINNPKTFGNKEDINFFVKQRQAEKLLNIKKSKILPKSFRIISGISNPIEEDRVMLI